jgi:hypothetical protein
MHRALLLLLLVPSLVSAADLSTLKGAKHSGELVSIDEGAVVIRSGGSDVSTPVPEIMQLMLKDAAAAKLPAKYIDVELIDGTLFHCAAVALKGKKADLALTSGLRLNLDLTSLAYVLNDAQDEAVRKEFGNIVAERVKSDRYFVRKDSRLDGLEGTFGDAAGDGKTMAFTMRDGEKRDLPLDRLAALLFNNRLEGNIPPTVCKVIDAGKNTIVAQKAVLKGKTLSILTVAGVTIDYPSLEPIVALDYSKDKIVYLSDLKPGAVAKSFDELPRDLGKDLNLDNDPILLEGVPYSKGLTMHAPMTLTYDINGEFKEFKTTLGVDTSVQTPSHVRLIFEGDGRKLFETEVTVKDAPKPVTLDVKKVRQLTIRLTQAEGLPYGHQVTLADAKVTK